MGKFTGSKGGGGKSQPQIPLGNHTLEIQRCTQDRARKGFDYFAADLTVVETDNPDLPVGATVGLFVKMEEPIPFDMLIQEFLCHPLGYATPWEVDPEDYAAVVSAEAPLRGERICCRGIPALDKKTSKPIPIKGGGFAVNYSWSAAPEAKK